MGVSFAVVFPFRFDIIDKLSYQDDVTSMQLLWMLVTSLQRLYHFLGRFTHLNKEDTNLCAIFHPIIVFFNGKNSC